MSSIPELTEKLLIETGGWQVFKQARTLFESGRVQEATWQPPMLQGNVTGDRTYRAGLKISSRVKIENLCTCRPSKEWGTICAHSIAVGLAVVKGARPQQQKPSVLLEEKASADEVPPNFPFQLAGQLSATHQLFILLPPNIASAWNKEQMMLGLEMVALSKGPKSRGLVDAFYKGLQPKERIVVDLHDWNALKGWARVVGDSTQLPSGLFVFDPDQFLNWLRDLQGHPRVTLGRGISVKIGQPSGPQRPTLEAKFIPGQGLHLEVQWKITPQIVLTSKQPNEPTQTWVYTVASGSAPPQFTPLVGGLPNAYCDLYRQPVDLPPSQGAAFLIGEWQKLEPFFTLKLDSSTNELLHQPAAKDDYDELRVEPVSAADVLEVPKFVLHLEGSLNELTARLEAVYQEDRKFQIQWHSEWKGKVEDFQTSRIGTFSGRNYPVERLAWKALIQCGFYGPLGKENHYVLKGEDTILGFFANQLSQFQRDWTVHIGGRFERVTEKVDVVVPQFSVRSPSGGQDWFELDFSLVTASGKQAFSAAEIQRLLSMKRHSARLKDGKMAALPTEALEEFQTVLNECQPDQSRPGTYRIKNVHASYLDSALEQLRSIHGGEKALEGWQKWKREKQGAGLARVEPIGLPNHLEPILREYQKQGVYWLHFLNQNGWCGILADEMGLGKTLQMLAFLSYLKAQNAKTQRTNLIVCPTSLVENWQREAARFTPELKTLLITGPYRHSELGRIPDSDLVITSYGLLRRDIDHYRSFPFATVVLDEAHHIKNPDSQSARAACALKSQSRFVLTGTPMENSVRDLWSIMHFLMPGFLGNRQDFRQRYELPILQGGAEGVAMRERLQRRLRACLLRRRKREVVKELPDKIEQVIYCDLTAVQATAYQQLLEASRAKVDLALKQKNAGQGRVIILTTLLRLRQACCDLRLLGLEPQTATPVPQEPQSENENFENDLGIAAEAGAAPQSSGKLILLDELLEQIREGNHRVLIFSQFASMLQLLSQHLKSQAIEHAYLDGQTKNRAAVVDRFQNDPTVTAFLISIKAGGVGLNLTAADTVIHFDPWWNPAVEAQATDRAHRIGQKKIVTVYKMIARSTIEEKILDLQRRKREVTAQLIENQEDSDESFMNSLSLEEMESLLH